MVTPETEKTQQLLFQVQNLWDNVLFTEKTALVILTGAVFYL